MMNNQIQKDMKMHHSKISKTLKEQGKIFYKTDKGELLCHAKGQRYARKATEKDLEAIKTKSKLSI